MAGRASAVPSDGCVWKDGDAFSSGGGAWEGGLTFHPPRYAKVFQAWHENLRDWCISRQLWWGHQIPVWSAPEDTHFDGAQFGDRVAEQVVGGRRFVCVRSDADADAVSALEAAGYARDPDVLDTWFSSGLWPMSTMGWPRPEQFAADIPEGDAVLEAWNPGSVLCTAREIITLWVSRMVMFNLYFRDCLPFVDVCIHAMIQDGEGQKMSKSLGNGVDPLDIIHSHGADGMRFTLADMATDMQDVRMPVDVVCPHTGETFAPKMVTISGGTKVAAATQNSPSAKGKKMVTSYGVASGTATPDDNTPLARNTSSKFDYGRNFANKLWNAVRFALGNLEADGTSADGELALADRWILTRMARTVDDATAALENFQFSVYAQALYDFTWRDFCDWYVEAVKPTVREHPEQRRVLAACIDTILRLLHPAMPFITERLWERLAEVAPERSVDGLTAPTDAVLARAPWPKVSEALVDSDAESAFDRVRHLVSAIREVRTTHKVPPRQTVVCSVRCGKEETAALERHAKLVETLAGSEFAAVGADTQRPENAGSTVLGEMEIYVHDLVDAGAEKERLTKLLDDVSKKIKTLSGRLSKRELRCESAAGAGLSNRGRNSPRRRRKRRRWRKQLGALR